MPQHKMQVAGLPVDPRFKPALVDRRTLGLERDRLTVLLVGGGEGMAQVYSLARTITSARLPLQLVIIAGRNSRLRQRLESSVWEIPTVVRGFETNMHLWMQAADVIVTKAGPGTISEAATVGLPILLYGFVPGQEAGNVRWVVDSGAGLFVNTPEKLVAALRELADPGSIRLAEMRDRASRLARPDAALQIARLILSLMFP